MSDVLYKTPFDKLPNVTEETWSKPNNISNIGSKCNA